jgi:hypothetical protein
VDLLGQFGAVKFTIRVFFRNFAQLPGSAVDSVVQLGRYFIENPVQIFDGAMISQQVFTGKCGKEKNQQAGRQAAGDHPEKDDKIPVQPEHIPAILSPPRRRFSGAHNCLILHHKIF